jgi:hypothetical protein
MATKKQPAAGTPRMRKGWRNCFQNHGPENRGLRALQGEGEERHDSKAANEAYTVMGTFGRSGPSSFRQRGLSG